jgi:hypothetical protein
MNQITSCMASQLPDVERRKICLLLVQKAPTSDFVSAHERMFEAWQKRKIDTDELNAMLNLPIWSVNRFALLSYNPRGRTIISNALIAINASQDDLQNKQLMITLKKLHSGQTRAEALISLYWVSHDQPSSYVAYPSRDDDLSFAGSLIEFAIVYWYLAVILLLSVFFSAILFLRIWHKQKVLKKR